MIYATFRIEANRINVNDFILTHPNDNDEHPKTTDEFRKRVKIAINRRLGARYELDNVYRSFQSPELEIIVLIKELVEHVTVVGVAAGAYKFVKDYKSNRESIALLTEDINNIIRKIIKKDTINSEEETSVHEKYPPESGSTIQDNDKQQ